LNTDATKCSNSQQKLQEELDLYANKYEAALKEKMLMKLEKDRLKAKVDNLEYNLRQQEEDAKLEGGSVAELNGQSKAFSKSQLTSA
jgi:hypothetical protein